MKPLSRSVLFAITTLSAFAQSSPTIVEAPTFEVVATRLTTTSASPTTDLTLDPTAAPGELALPTLAAEIAGFAVGSNQSRSFTDTFAIRGLTNTPIFGAPAVTVYLDDLPLGSGFTFPSDLTGFAQAQLLRGPGAGTRFGRSGPGGILLLSTPTNPTASTGSLTLAVGDHGARSATVTGASAAGGELDAYVAATWRERDGYVRNTTLNQDVDPQETQSALARLRWRASERAEFTLFLNALRARDGAQPLVPLFGPLYTVQRSAEGETHLDAFNAALTAAVTTDGGRLTTTTGFSHWDMGPYSNTLDFGFAELGNGSTLTQKNLSEEIIFTAHDDAAFPWRAGFFVNDGQTNGSFTRDFGGFTFEQSDYQFDVLDLALFGEATFALTDALDLTTGLRLVKTEMDSVRTETVPVPQVTPASHSSDAILPHLNLRQDLGHGTTAFANIAMGYKTGGFSAFTGNAALAPYDAEYTTAYEAGVTHATADGRYSVTVRAYLYDIDDYQIERSFATQAAADDYLVVNADSARSIGGELELAWRPVQGLELAASYGLTDTTLRGFTDPYTGDVFNDNRVPYVPTHDAHLRADYVTDAGFFVGATVSRVGKTYYTEAEDPTFMQDTYTLLHARLGYTAERYRIQLSGTNITDEEYYSAITPGTFHGTPGTPRTFLGEVTFRF
ncbi:TonB-dependent receptor [Synoicihabitans lomoniglobus]|uniref:TonB-dependent receptor n=1 Tax=Synoicihabitans lomoniglobus TaxID=2909285 RepID=A0AAE9ZVJ1_9BACT|nr:TonB-dependent receptor [Opitutaceae bacterium LMO-M01]WED64872.1 TonB-dependent receptor [Opitutaceae bacterium LMO-M01]